MGFGAELFAPKRRFISRRGIGWCYRSYDIKEDCSEELKVVSQKTADSRRGNLRLNPKSWLEQNDQIITKRVFLRPEDAVFLLYDPVMPCVAHMILISLT